MKPYNPKRSHFIYPADYGGLAAGARDDVRVQIDGKSWFYWHALIGLVTFAAGGAPTAENIFVNIFDSGTGRGIFGEPVSIDGIVPQLSRLAAFDAAEPGFIFRQPFYFPLPFNIRPASTLRVEFDNRNAGGTGAATIRLALIGLKVKDPREPDRAPGKTFTPFTAVVNFGTLAASEQRTVGASLQEDVPFDVVSITGSWNLLNSTPGRVFMSMKDAGSDDTYEKAPIPAHSYIGPPHSPFRPIRPIRFFKSEGLNVTLQETAAAPLTLTQVLLHGYKVHG